MKKINLTSCLLLMLVSFVTHAQDATFSNIKANQLYFNPAYAGLSRGFSASLTHRVLWANIPEKFNTSILSVDQYIPHKNGLGGVGLMFVTDVEGYGLQMNTISIPFSIRIKTADKKYLQFGASAAFVQKMINSNNYVFSEQLDQINGIVTQTSSFVLPTNKLSYPDVSSGLLFENRNFLKTYSNSKANLIMGIAAHHLFQPDDSFYNTNAKIPIKWVMHASAEIPLNINKSDFTFLPGIQIQKQAQFNTFFAGSNFYCDKLIFGAWFRRFKTWDAIAIVAGCVLGEKLFFSYAYDITISRLSTNTGGSHEISIVYKVDNLLKAIGLKQDCKNAGTF